MVKRTERARELDDEEAVQENDPEFSLSL